MEFKRLFTFLVIFRLSSVYFISSWFVPDELYQSAEVAHHLVYGTGHLSWEWKSALRSYFHPAIIAIVYELLNLIGLGDNRVAVFYFPRILHAFLFAISDLFFYKLCRRLCITKHIANLSFVTYISSWFPYYCSSRTLSNSLETIFTLIALNWFPFEGPRYKGPVWPYIALGVVSIIVRPTVALLWIVFGIYHLLIDSDPLRLVLRTVLPISIPIVICSIILDSFAYGAFTVPLWNFLQFNVLQGGSALFGVHPWHWYITSGLPSVMTIQLIPIILGLLGQNIFRPTLVPLYSAVFYIIFHSLLPHKEQRFLLPIIPLLCLYAGGTFINLKGMFKTGISLMVIVNIVVVIFSGRYHQVGPFSVSSSIIDHNIQNDKLSIISLTPCYSLPGFAYWHTDIDNFRMLDCSPDLTNSRKGPDEADLFHSDVVGWLNANFTTNQFQYNRIVMYEKYYKLGKNWFFSNDWVECFEKVWHSIALTSSREDQYLVVLCKPRVQ